MEVRAFPWKALPRWSRRLAVAAAGLAAPPRLGAELPGIGAVSLSASAPRRAPTTSRFAAVMAIRWPDGVVYAVIEPTLWRTIAQRMFGGIDELAAPRRPSATELGLVAVAVASVLDAGGWPGEVEPVEVEPAEVGLAPGHRAAPLDADDAVAVAIAVDGAVSGAVELLIPAAVLVGIARRPLAEHARRAAWLDEATVRGHLVIAAAHLDAARAARLAPRDVVVVARVAEGRGELRLGRGCLAVELATAGKPHTVVGSYGRTGGVNERLGEDLGVEVAVSLGAVVMSVREALELAPGRVISLGRPLGGPVEIAIAGKLVGRGELVDVDGELGVRVLAIDPQASE